MKAMRLFYGADSLVSKPQYGKGNPNNDYGLGFYMTPELRFAKLWASKFNNGGFAITYDADISKLNVLYLNSNSELDILKWITILVSHRFDKDTYDEYKERIAWLRKHFYPDLEGVDMIVGYRADDSYFAYSESFVKNELSIEMLSQAMKLGKLGLQYVLISKKTFEYISYVNHEPVIHSEEYTRFREETLNEYREIKNNDNDRNTFIRDIIRKYDHD